MRKIKYRKGRKVQPNSLEYTGVHKNKESEMQLFVYDEVSFSEYVDFEFKDLNKLVDITKNNWLNIHGLNNLELNPIHLNLSKLPLRSFLQELFLDLQSQ